LIRIPVIFLRWLLIDTLNLSIDKEDTVKISRAGWYPIRTANRNVVTNGISSPKTKGKLVWALMLLLLCGNWLSHHLVLGASIVAAFYLYKISISIFKNLKNC
jgi:hypothetical protein